MPCSASGPPWRWRWRRGGRGRPPKDRLIWFAPPGTIAFIPCDEGGTCVSTEEPVYIMPDELEALRLVYLEGLSQEEAAKKMGVSRGTLWRALDSGRRKIVEALVKKKPIVLLPPDGSQKP